MGALQGETLIHVIEIWDGVRICSMALSAIAGSELHPVRAVLCMAGSATSHPFCFVQETMGEPELHLILSPVIIGGDPRVGAMAQVTAAVPEVSLMRIQVAGNAILVLRDRV